MFLLSSENIGLSLGFSPFIIGATLLAIGTSLPELLTSLIAVKKEEVDFIISNVIGSNIANIFLILGISTLIVRNIKIGRDLLSLDIPLLIAATGVLLVVMGDGVVTRGEGILLLIGSIIATFGLVNNYGHDSNEKKKKTSLHWKWPLLTVASAICLYFAASWTITSVVQLADILHISSAVIAASAVAVGTSLPELAVSIQAVRKNEFSLAIGNVVGSNIFNALIVVGLPALFLSIPVPKEVYSLGFMFLILSVISFLLVGMTKKITFYEGAFFLLFYTIFIGKLFSFF